MRRLLLFCVWMLVAIPAQAITLGVIAADDKDAATGRIIKGMRAMAEERNVDAIIARTPFLGLDRALAGAQRQGMRRSIHSTRVRSL